MRFLEAWQAAARGERAVFEQALADLQGYLLYPYLQFEDLRDRRGQVDDLEMASFLAAHRDWAFTAGLERSWLRALVRSKRWDSLLTYAADGTETEVQCAYAEARIRAGRAEGLLETAQALWAVGRSQPEACDPVFAWLRREGGITPALAWERIRKSMEERQPRLTRYLARFLPEADRKWADRWYQQDQGGYRRLDQAAQWPANDFARDIARYGMGQLSKNDPDRAAQLFPALERHFGWPDEVRGALLSEIALWSAVGGSPEAQSRMQAVPVKARDDRLLEWWARSAMSAGDWAAVLEAVALMTPALADTARWRYWQARALDETGESERARDLLSALSAEANFHGFLAADQLGLPYSVCPESPTVAGAAIESLAHSPGFDRALELRRLGINNWARAEWALAARGLDHEGLRTAAGLAVRENWPDMAIFALGESGDQRWYEWRFPLEYSALVESSAGAMNLDPAWVMGLMRAESAMAADAISGAGARGLMQVMPGTATLLAKQHGYAYSGSEQLLSAPDNIRFGTTYLRDLLNRFQDNPALVSGAYNAGPGAVKRWLQDRPGQDPAIWIESLPYHETRDYIPRVLAFATLYDWRLQRPVSRISSRMPAFDSVAAGGTMQAVQTAEVVCRQAG